MEEGARKGKGGKGHEGQNVAIGWEETAQDGAQGRREASKPVLWGTIIAQGLLLPLGVLLLSLCSILASPKQRCIRAPSSWARHQDTWL